MNSVFGLHINSRSIILDQNPPSLAFLRAVFQGECLSKIEGKKHFDSGTVGTATE